MYFVLRYCCMEIITFSRIKHSTKRFARLVFPFPNQSCTQQVITEIAAANSEAADTGLNVADIDPNEVRGVLEEGGQLFEVQGAGEGL